MKTILTKLPLLTVAALLLVATVAVPTFAADDGADVSDEAQIDDAEADLPADETGEEEEAGGRPALAETPRDRLGLLLFAALGAAGVAGWIGMRRQLSGDHPTADGEFRWR